MDIIARILAMVPPWTRVYRVQRDIPMPLVTSGVEKGNLRELALARMEDLGLKCRDVRTREAGIQVSGIIVTCIAIYHAIKTLQPYFWYFFLKRGNKRVEVEIALKFSDDFRTSTTKLSPKKWS